MEDDEDELIGGGEGLGQFYSDRILGAQPCPPVEGNEAPESQDGGDTIMCWSGRPVINSRLLVVEFDDGTSGMVRKKSSFKPKHGLVMEVRGCEEEGFYELVGKYRDNGVRLDK